MYKKSCKHCGSEFEAKNVRKLYCSNHCKWNYVSQSKQTERTCAQCGLSMGKPKDTGRWKFCSKVCMKSFHRDQRSRFDSATRRARKLQATPKWANMDEIKKIYEVCPPGYEVDHYYPLKGDTMCGLHVSENLRIIPKEENRRKWKKLPT